MYEAKSGLLDFFRGFKCAFATPHNMVFVPTLTVRNVNKDYERNEKCSQIFAHLSGGMDCVTASYAGVAGSSPTGKEQKFVPLSFVHNPPITI